MRSISFILLLMVIFSMELPGAVGCDLNDPDRDVRRFFPESDGYRTLYYSIEKKGGNELLAAVEERLQDKFSGLYETAGNPYTMYQIYRGNDLIGYIHGVNQKGVYGGIQVFLSLDRDGIIKAVYFQKMSSKKAAKFRSREFYDQFVGLSLKDFYRYNPAKRSSLAGSKVSKIVNPAADAADDFFAIMRGIKKNLILVDEFLLSNRYLSYQKEG